MAVTLSLLSGNNTPFKLQNPLNKYHYMSRFEQLLLEAKQAILSSLSDIASLKATALTCSSLYHAFKNTDELIITKVLLNEIDIDIFPEAIITHKSEIYTSPALFAIAHLRTRIPIGLKKRWKIAELLPLSKDAKYINYFANDFATKALATTRRQISAPPSREELNRIKRAFYRFEIYGHMFRNLIPPSPLSHRQVWAPTALFFEHFSPWENEQLACVYDYLFSLIAPIFNDIVEHDVAWGEYSVRYAEDRDSGYIQYFLSLGLEKLYEIATTDSYESRYKLVYKKHPNASEFLFEGLEMAYPRTIHPFTRHVLHSHIVKSFFEDPDTGPVDAWSWAYQDEHEISDFVNSKSRSWLREWGYVFWDRSRLDERRILNAPCDTRHGMSKRDFGGLGNRGWGWTGLRASWERRQLIFMAGGVGWWSDDDESRVQWPRGWCPWDDEEMRRSCPFCIGEVRCAPHRLVLRVEGKQRVVLLMGVE